MINNTLRLFRIKAGLSQKEVAEALNITQGAVSAWELGRNRLSLEIAQKLADLYHASVNELLEINGQGPQAAGGQEAASAKEEKDCLIPLFSAMRIKANGLEKVFPPVCEVPVPSSYKKKWGSDILLLIARGTSMLPTIMPNDQLICIPGDTWEDGNIVIIDVNDSETIKRIYRVEDGGIDLVPDNPQYHAMHYSPEDIEGYQIRVIGRVAKAIGPDLL